MMFKLMLVLGIFPVVFYSCNQSGENIDAVDKAVSAVNSFSKAGITFEYPEDWIITESEDDELGTFVACERQGENESGIVIMTILEDKGYEEQNLINGYLQDLTADSLFMDFAASDIKQGKYHNYNAVFADYTVSDGGYIYKGTAYGFTTCGKAILLIEQTSDDDAAKSTVGFDIIKRSLKCAAI